MRRYRASFYKLGILSILFHGTIFSAIGRECECVRSALIGRYSYSKTRPNVTHAHLGPYITGVIVPACRACNLRVTTLLFAYSGSNYIRYVVRPRPINHRRSQAKILKVSILL